MGGRGYKRAFRNKGPKDPVQGWVAARGLESWQIDTALERSAAEAGFNPPKSRSEEERMISKAMSMSVEVWWAMLVTRLLGCPRLASETSS